MTGRQLSPAGVKYWLRLNSRHEASGSRQWGLLLCASNSENTGRMCVCVVIVVTCNTYIAFAVLQALLCLLLQILTNLTLIMRYLLFAVEVTVT